MRTCTRANCFEKHYGRGMCIRHYRKEANVKEIKARWLRENQEKRKETLRKYHLSEKYKNVSLKYRTSIETRYKRLIKGARDRKLLVSLTFEEYVEIFGPGLCSYCLNQIGPGFGLDRLDNSQGYLKSNVVACCENCNKLRQDRLTPSELKEIIFLLKQLRGRDNLWNESSTTTKETYV